MSEIDRRSLGRNPALDGLRGIAILLIILGSYHPQVTGHEDSLFAVLAGPLGQRLTQIGITLFLLLSGYLNTRSLMRLPAGHRVAWKFMARRAARVVPLYLGVVVAVAALNLGAKWDRDQLINVASLSTFTANIRIALSGQGTRAASRLWVYWMGAMWPVSPSNVMQVGGFWMGVLWPVSLYLQLCVVWGFFFQFLRRRPALVFKLAWVSIGVGWIFSSADWYLLNLDAWAAGAWLALVIDRYDKRLLVRNAWLAAVTGLALMLATVRMENAGMWPFPPAMDLMWGGVVTLAALGDGWGLRRSPLAGLGRVGYGVSLIQVVIVTPVATWLGQSEATSGNLQIPLAVLLSAASSAALAVPIYYLWEKPWMSWGRRFKDSTAFPQVTTSGAQIAAKRRGWHLPVRLRGSDAVFNICGALTCVILLLGMRVYDRSQVKPPVVPIVMTGMFEPYGLNAFQFYWVPPSNPYAQRVTYQVVCLAIGLTSLIALFWHPHIQNRRVRSGVVVTALLLEIAVVIYYLSRCADLIVTYGGMGVLVITLISSRFARGKLAKKLFIAAAIVLLAGSTLPGFWTRLNLTYGTWTFIDIIQVHYDGVVSLGDRLANGLHLFRDAVPHYGVILPLILATWIHYFGQLSWGGYVWFIQILECVYLYVAAWCYYRICGRNKAIFFLVALFACTHYEFTESMHRWYPNHSAFRHIGTPLGIMMMILMKNRRAIRAAPILGIAAGIAVLLNVEVGVSVTAGLATFIFLQFFSRQTRRSAGLFFALPISFGLGMLAALAAFVLAYRVVLGYWADFSLAPEFFHHIKLVSATGFGTTTGIAFQPLATLFFAHAALALIYSMAAHGSRSGPRNSVRGGVAALMITWFVYYANRPSGEYLYCYYVPYGILLVDTLLTVAAIRRYRTSAIGWSAMTAVMFVIVPYLTFDARGMFWAGDSTAAFSPPAHSTMMSGVYVPAGARADGIREKSAYLQSLPDHDHVYYITMDSYLIPKVSGVWSAIPLFDAYAEAITPADYEKLMSGIINSSQSIVYIDSEASVKEGGTPGEMQYYRVLRHDLSPYFRMIDTQSGWERWQRLPTGGK